MRKAQHFLYALWFFCAIEATTVKPRSPKLNPSLMHMVEGVLEELSYPTQKVHILDVSFEMGRSLHFKVLFGYEEKRCFLNFSIRNLGNTQINHLVCDSPCAKGECGVDKELVSQLYSDFHEKVYSTDGQKKTRSRQDKTRLQACCRRCRQKQSVDNKNEGRSVYELNSGENLGGSSVNKYTFEVPYVQVDSSEELVRVRHEVCCKSCRQKQFLEDEDTGSSSSETPSDDDHGGLSENQLEQKTYVTGIVYIAADKLVEYVRTRLKACCRSCHKKQSLEHGGAANSSDETISNDDRGEFNSDKYQGGMYNVGVPYVPAVMSVAACCRRCRRKTFLDRGVMGRWNDEIVSGDNYGGSSASLSANGIAVPPDSEPFADEDIYSMQPVQYQPFEDSSASLVHSGLDALFHRKGLFLDKTSDEYTPTTKYSDSYRLIKKRRRIYPALIEWLRKLIRAKNLQKKGRRRRLHRLTFSQLQLRTMGPDSETLLMGRNLKKLAEKSDHQQSFSMTYQDQQDQQNQQSRLNLSKMHTKNGESDESSKAFDNKKLSEKSCIPCSDCNYCEGCRKHISEGQGCS